MKIAGLIIGIVLMLLSGIGLIISLMLPSMTNNRINFREATIWIIVSAVLFVFSFLITVGAGVFLLMGRKRAAK